MPFFNFFKIDLKLVKLYFICYISILRCFLSKENHLMKNFQKMNKLSPKIRTYWNIIIYLKKYGPFFALIVSSGPSSCPDQVVDVSLKTGLAWGCLTPLRTSPTSRHYPATPRAQLSGRSWSTGCRESLARNPAWGSPSRNGRCGPPLNSPPHQDAVLL